LKSSVIRFNCRISTRNIKNITLVLFQDEAEKLNEIWKTREGAGGLWALLVCMILSGFEVCLGFSAFGAWLRYNDLVDKFKARNHEIELGLAFPDIYGSLVFLQFSRTF